MNKIVFFCFFACLVSLQAWPSRIGSTINSDEKTPEGNFLDDSCENRIAANRRDEEMREEEKDHENAVALTEQNTSRSLDKRTGLKEDETNFMEIGKSETSQRQQELLASSSIDQAPSGDLEGTSVGQVAPTRHLEITGPSKIVGPKVLDNENLSSHIASFLLGPSPEKIRKDYEEKYSANENKDYSRAGYSRAIQLTKHAMSYLTQAVNTQGVKIPYECFAESNQIINSNLLKLKNVADQLAELGEKEQAYQEELKSLQTPIPNRTIPPEVIILEKEKIALLQKALDHTKEANEAYLLFGQKMKEGSIQEAAQARLQGDQAIYLRKEQEALIAGKNYKITRVKKLLENGNQENKITDNLDIANFWCSSQAVLQFQYALRDRTNGNENATQAHEQAGDCALKIAQEIADNGSKTSKAQNLKSTFDFCTDVAQDFKEWIARTKKNENLAQACEKAVDFSLKAVQEIADNGYTEKAQNLKNAADWYKGVVDSLNHAWEARTKKNENAVQAYERAAAFYEEAAHEIAVNGSKTSKVKNLTYAANMCDGAAHQFECALTERTEANANAAKAREQAADFILKTVQEIADTGNTQKIEDVTYVARLSITVVEAYKQAVTEKITDAATWHNTAIIEFERALTAGINGNKTVAQAHERAGHFHLKGAEEIAHYGRGIPKVRDLMNAGFWCNKAAVELESALTARINGNEAVAEAYEQAAALHLDLAQEIADNGNTPAAEELRDAAAAKLNIVN